MISLGPLVPGKAVITPHGYWGAPRPRRKGIHEGVDLHAEEGTPVYAGISGKVARLGFDKPVDEGGGGGGNYVIVASQDSDKTPIELGYMHLSRVDVTKGQDVSADTQIGLAGASGTAEGQGSHLHFQVKRLEAGGRKAIDPTSWLNLGKTALAGISIGIILLAAGAAWLLLRD